MGPDWIPTVVKAAADEGLLKQIYGDLAKPGVAQVGQALSSVLGLGNTILWPLQLLNERAKLLLELNLNRYRQKLEQIPLEKVCPVPPEVGVPIVEKLGYVADPDLREMYAALLAKASSTDTQSQAHPSFVNVLNNMSPDEALLIRQFQQQGGGLPFVSVRFDNPQTGLFMQLVDVQIEIFPSTKLAYPHNLPAYVSNLEGLGLIDVRRDIFVAPVERYLPIETAMRHQYSQLDLGDGFTMLNCPRGKIEVTRFGWLFISACMQ